MKPTRIYKCTVCKKIFNENEMKIGFTSSMGHLTCNSRKCKDKASDDFFSRCSD